MAEIEQSKQEQANWKAPEALESKDSEQTRGKVEASSMDEGLTVATQRIDQLLQSTDKRPIIVFANGPAGSGKTYLSEALTAQLQSQRHKTVFLETDLYDGSEHGGMSYTKEIFASQKAAWESGQPFVFHNTRSHQNETIASPDVVVIGGIDAKDDDKISLKGDLKIAVSTPFQDRLARKAVRDYIVDKGEEGLQQYLAELCEATPNPDNDLLYHWLQQEEELKNIANDSDIVIHNQLQADDQPRVVHQGDQLQITAAYNGKTYSAQRSIPTQRIELLNRIAEIRA
jgi:uridine kinase